MKQNEKSEEQPRVGVFICRCGLNIAKSVDTSTLVEFAKTLPGVVYAEENEFTCSEAGQQSIREKIKEHNINRVVVASCSPRLHEPTFQRVVEEAGLNKFLFEMANIREQCSWIYLGQIERATEKAKHIVNAAVERAKTLEPIDKMKMSANPSVLVIGGGPSGVEAANRLGDLGLEVYLIERTPFIGGKALQLGSVFPTDDCGTCISPCQNDLHRRCFYRSPISHHPYVNILTSTELKKLDGYVGKYTATLSINPRFVNPELCMSCGKCAEACPVKVPNEFNLGLDERKAIYLPSNQALPRVYAIDPESCTRCGRCIETCPVDAISLEEKPREVTVDVGAIVVATGFETFDGKGMYGFGEYANVINQLKLARMLDMSGPTQGRVLIPGEWTPPKRVAMIQCVGSRDPKTNEYCSKICCAIALKHSIAIKEQLPESEVVIIHKDIRLSGKDYEDYYYKAQSLSVKLLRGEVEGVSKIQDGHLRVDIKDEFGDLRYVDVDLLVLSTGVVQSKGAGELAHKLGLSLSQDQFFMERHPKLAPLDTAVEGIYLCGACQGPKDIQESITQAQGTVSRVAALLLKGEIEIDLVKAQVDAGLCIGCGACASACPYKAITWQPFGLPEVIEAACKGCGICAATCPVGAMQLRHFKDDQLIPKIKAILGPEKWLDEEKKGEPVVVCLACQWCSYAAADAAGSMKLEYPENLRIILVPCTGRVDALHIFTAFKHGADGVIVAGCLPEQCHYIDGNLKAEDRVEAMKKALDVMGIGGERLEMIFAAACMPIEFTEMVTEFVKKIQRLNIEKVEEGLKTRVK
ncbi:MAG: hydrogenase iron-sulfur subunit [Candidatus Bathyarchaeia archaeon]